MVACHLNLSETLYYKYTLKYHIVLRLYGSAYIDLRDLYICDMIEFSYISLYVYVVCLHINMYVDAQEGVGGAAATRLPTPIRPDAVAGAGKWSKFLAFHAYSPSFSPENVGKGHLT